MDNSSQQVIPRRDEEFHSLKNKFNIEPQNFKKITKKSNSKVISSENGIFQARNPDLTQNEIADPTNTVSPTAEAEEVKMPSVRELAMKFKATQLIQPKPAKKVSTTTLPNQQVTIGEAKSKDAVKTTQSDSKPTQPPSTTNKAIPVLQQPTPVKRMSKPSEQLPENVKPRPDLPQKTVESVPINTLPTEKDLLSSVDQLDAHEIITPAPAARTAPPKSTEVTEHAEVQHTEPQDSKPDQLDAQNTPPIQSTVETVSHDNIQELNQERTTEQTVNENNPTKHQPPKTLEISTTDYQKTTSEDEVFSPPLPKTPPPHKVPFFPPVPKTPPPSKTPFFTDLIDPSVTVITPTSAGSNSEELFLSLIPEVNDNKISNGGNESIVEQFLMSPSDNQVKWDAFAEINNNNKKSIERKISVAAAAEVYEKKSPSPVDVQKTFLQEESEYLPISPDKSEDSETIEVHSDKNGELVQISETKDTTDSSLVDEIDLKHSSAEIKATDADEIKATDADEIKATDADVIKAKDADEIKAKDADEIKARDVDVGKFYNRQTSEINSSSLQTKEVLNRTLSLPYPNTNTDPERRKTAIEVLATPPTFRPKEEEELIKLRNQIVRASRSRTPQTPVAK